MFYLRDFIKKNKWNFNRKCLLIVIISIYVFFICSNIKSSFNTNSKFSNLPDNYNYFSNHDSKPNISAPAVDYDLNITNTAEINNSIINPYSPGTNITIEGTVEIDILGPLQNGNVSLLVDGFQYSQFNDTTNVNGEFTINFTIPKSLYIKLGHMIQVNVTDDLVINYLNYAVIYTNTTSRISAVNPSTPKFSGEQFTLQGYLTYENGTGIPNALINYTWLINNISIFSKNFTTYTLGDYRSVEVPSTALIGGVSELTLKLNFTSPPHVNYSETSVNVKVFSDITCFWNIEPTATEGEGFVIAGRIVSSTNTSLGINDRDFRLYYDVDIITTITTDVDGRFSHTYTIPSGVDEKTIEVKLIHYEARVISETNIITVEAAAGGGGTASTTDPTVDDTPAPFENFFLVFIPIIIGVAAGLSAYGYHYYRKLKMRSIVAKLPLEGKMRNLKILKDTGRLEESLSYLFSALYMELVNAKFGRRIKETETIRDFAIISVKELSLNPAAIYPFIQKIEEIIYGRPFQINEKTFYETCELFSPIYLDFTGQEFLLNF